MRQNQILVREADLIMVPLTAFVVLPSTPNAEWQYALWVTDSPWSWVAR